MSARLGSSAPFARRVARRSGHETAAGVLLVAMSLLPARAAEAQRRELPPGDYCAPVNVECATFLGTKGSEVLSAGVFLPDGRFLIGGICQDPEIALRGVQAKVVGRDAPPLPAVDAWRPLGVVASGKIASPKIGDVAIVGAEGSDPGGSGIELRTDAEADAEKRRKEDERTLIASIPNDLKWSAVNENNVEEATPYRKFAWLDAECTAFWGIFSEDLKTVAGLWRLPRGAGSITAMGLAGDGTVYIAGGACGRIEGAAANVRTLPAITASNRRRPYAVPLAYVARLSADFTSIAWIRTMPMDESAPKLRVLRSGDVVVSNPDIRRFSPDGELKLGSAVSRSRYPDSVSINPVTGGWCKGGDFMSMTGREPYRTPYFFIYEPDGTQYLELWRWRGSFAAVDGLGHLVADAQVEKTAYDEEGNLVVTARSHGGNCVHARYPWDITRFLPGDGRFARSPGGIVKLSPDFKLIGGGSFSDPGFFSRVEHGVDGSVVLMMSFASGRTANALSGLGSGRLVAVVSPDLSARRFASVFPGVGQRLVIGGGSRPEDWSSASGWSQGKPKLLLLSGAGADEQIGLEKHKTPVRNPVQGQFAGGRLDGYAVLFDLSPGPAKPLPTEPPKTVAKVGPKKERLESPPLMPVEGQRFEMGNVSWVTAHFDFREDPAGDLWPRFYTARASSGDGFSVSMQESSRASFTLRAGDLQQADCNQDRRLFGARLRMKSEAGQDGKARSIPDPPVSLEIREMSRWGMQTNRIERENDVILERKPATTVSGVLRIGEHAVPVKDAPCTAYYTVPREVTPDRPGVKPNYVCMRIRFRTTGRAMGFNDPDLAEKTIAVLVSCTGFAQVEYEELKKVVPVLPPLGGQDAQAEAVDE
jgi:hypothetical protein